MRSKTLSLCIIACFAVLMAIGAWIAVPTVPPFTLQSLVIYVAVWLLGGKRAAAALFLYLLMGVAGLPVFSGFQSGVGVLLGPTGGYLIGFSAVVLFGSIPTKSTWRRIAVLAAGTLSCYAIGTAWYVLVYAGGASTGVAAVLAMCVLPFLLPDALKLCVAVMMAKRLELPFRRYGIIDKNR